MPPVATSEESRRSDSKTDKKRTIHEGEDAEAKKAKAAEDEDYARQNLAVARRNLVVGRRLVCVTWVLAVIGGGIGLLQAAIFWKQVTTTRQVERPWLLPKVDIPAWDRRKAPKNLPVPLELHWSVTNVGRGPAWIVRLKMGFTIIPEAELKGGPPYEIDETAVPLPLGPETGHHGNVFPCDELDRYPAFLDGSKRLVVVGEAHYRDAWGKPHVSRFCFSWRFRKTEGGTVYTTFTADGPAHWTEYT